MTSRTLGLSATTVVAALVVALFMLSGGGTAVEEVRAASLMADELDRPAPGDVVLRVEGGAVANTTDGALELSLDHLARLRTVRAEILEPFVDERRTFEGVPIADLLTFAGISDGAQSAYTLALNDYAVTIPIDALRRSGAILATSDDGAPIPLDAGGPIRIVFTEDHPDYATPDYWNWSLMLLRVQG